MTVKRLERRAEFLLGVRTARVERAHDALDHRQEQRPFRIVRREVTLESVGDEAVLGHAEQRLIRHLSEHD